MPEFPSRREAFAMTGAASLAVAAARARAEPVGGPAIQRTYVVCHGAWSAGWAWKKMRPLLHRPPHSQLFTPTYTGMGERAHLATPEVSLETHIADMLGVLEMEDLTDVTLLGHSYGGMVATGVADRAPRRVSRLIYVDAFVPESGQSLYDITGEAPSAEWRVPVHPIPRDTSAEDVAWMAPRRLPQPLKTLTTRLTFTESNLPPRAFIKCMKGARTDPFWRLLVQASARGWPTAEIDSGHNAHVTAPAALAARIEEIARRIDDVRSKA